MATERKFKVLWNDTETTGLTEKHGLIQWSAKVFIDGIEVDSIDLKIQPHPSDEISNEALETNHITKEELYSSDRFTPKVAYQAIIGLCARHVDKYAREDKFVWKGFNARFDMDRTRDFFTKMGDKYFGSYFWFPPADIMGLAMHILQKERYKFPDFKQRTVWDMLHPDKKEEYTDDQWHDALFDLDRCRDIESALRARLQKGITTAQLERDQFKMALEASEEAVKNLEDKYDTLNARNVMLETKLADKLVQEGVTD